MKGSAINVVAAVIRRGGRVLLCSRPENKPPSGWEFPGGKINNGETPAMALRRELREELGVESKVLDSLFHIHTETGIEIRFMRVELAPEVVVIPQEGQQCRWTDLVSEVPDGLLPADLQFWRFLTF